MKECFQEKSNYHQVVRRCAPFGHIAYGFIYEVNRYIGGSFSVGKSSAVVVERECFGCYCFIILPDFQRAAQ